MLYFVGCPFCDGLKFKVGNGSSVEIECPKCKANLLIEMKDNQIAITKIENKQEKN